MQYAYNTKEKEYKISNKNILELKQLKVLQCQIHIQIACNWRMVYKYNSYATRKIPYRKMLNGIRIVKLSKQPLSIVYRGKEKKVLLVKINKISIT